LEPIYSNPQSIKESTLNPEGRCRFDWVIAFCPTPEGILHRPSGLDLHLLLNPGLTPWAALPRACNAHEIASFLQMLEFKMRRHPDDVHLHRNNPVGGLVRDATNLSHLFQHAAVRCFSICIKDGCGENVPSHRQSLFLDEGIKLKNPAIARVLNLRAVGATIARCVNGRT
jgi:hypothetical protein